ncbi:MAG: hypothetical protein WEC75_04540 [Dehalococcoidia bacterium]
MSPARRVIGRILSLGFPLPGPSCDNYTFVNAPSFFDYDAIVVEPSGLSALIESLIADGAQAATFGREKVRNVPQAPGEVALAEVLLRRREETRIALQNGAAIVCFAHPAVAHGVAGGEGLDDYCWLPLPDDVALRPPQLVPAGGTRVDVVDHEHSLAAFVAGQAANLAYRARLDPEQIPGFASRWRVFARSSGGAVVGAELAVDAGRVILLPTLSRLPSGDQRYVVSNALQAGIRRALGVMAEGHAPNWLPAFPLPGLDERAAAVAHARTAVEAAQAAVHAAEVAHEELARYQRLLWQEGELGLHDVVLDALRLIGFDVQASDAADLRLRAEGASLLLDIDSGEGTVDMAPHHRLRQRIERAIERTGSAPRGLLVVNGCRLLSPSGRPQQVTDALRLAAETMRYCVAPTTTLFDAVVAQMSGDAEAVAECRRRLVTTDGLLA